jgi:catechol 2,3-dioxygenase-like lactoylglutathione lyase family enzyme
MVSQKGRIARIARIGLTVSDLDAGCAFYSAALGFEEVRRERRSGSAFAALTGLAEARAEASILRLGAQEIELVAYRIPGRPYPAPRSAADPWFQHFAIVTSEMGAAYQSLRSRPGWTPISSDGPQQLPPDKGSIIAFKFRDPDGHPLELSWFPPEQAGAWGKADASRLFLGIDHSALAVRDMAKSREFYCNGLGLLPAGSQLNAGPTQAGLDGLPEAEVEIASLNTGEDGPHVELLHYRGGHAQASDRLAANDVAATRIIAGARNSEALAAASTTQGGGRVSTPGTRPGRELLSDPDGHLIELFDEPQANAIA